MPPIAIFRALQREHADQDPAGGCAKHAGDKQKYASEADRANGGLTFMFGL